MERAKPQTQPVTIQQFDEQLSKVINEMDKLAALSPGGGLYIKDTDFSGGVFALSDILVDPKGNLRLEASMWRPTEIANKTGYFR